MARKKQANTDKGDEFGIEVEAAETGGKRQRKDGSGDHVSKKSRTDGPSATRQHKNEKYGFGGAKRNIKSNTRKSTDEMDKFSVKKMKSGAKPSKKAAPRPGKDKRSSARNKQ